MGAEFFIGRAQSFGVDNQIVLGQELTGNARRGIHISAAVLLQVQYQVLHALVLQVLDGFLHFIMARATETGQADKPHSGGYHESRIYGRYRNLVPRDDEFQSVFDTVPHHT